LIGRPGDDSDDDDNATRKPDVSYTSIVPGVETIRILRARGGGAGRRGELVQVYNRHLLAVPRFRLNTYGRRAFSVVGPMAWNSLPDFICDPTSSTDCFRRLLKTNLFARY